jgi:cell pole-organizing protein PopZ
MSEPKSQAEPTMEEILASIRRIISEDGEDGEKAAAPAPEPVAEEAAAAEPAPVEDVLELTQMVDDDGSVVNLAGAPPSDEIALDDEPEPTPPPRFNPSFGDEPEETMAPPDDWSPPRHVPPTGDGLLSPDAAALANAAFLRVGALLTQGPGGPKTVEDLVAELLKPMLKAWLDEHLPETVERLVAAEIARVSGRGGFKG